MENYYAILGVDAQASAESIKAAFKKLALQYHPDIYKGPDADERMRALLQAYQTLNDPEARKAYDAQFLGKSTERRSATRSGSTGGRQSSQEQDQAYAFPDLSSTPTRPVSFQLGPFFYQLSPTQAGQLRGDGLLSGIDAPTARAAYTCHRCAYHWRAAGGSADSPQSCPRCHSRDWAEYLLLRCLHCQAIFESKEIVDPLRGGSRYYPYELFPLCPHCRRSHWCPAENERVARLRASTLRWQKLLWGSIFGACLIGIAFLILVAFR
jgi:hypothetical protein